MEQQGMRLFRRHKEEHEEIHKVLDEHEDKLEDMSSRLAEVELRVGIHKPRVLAEVERSNNR